MGVYIWNKLPSEYQEVEYIQSSGTQYIDTGIKPTNKTLVDTKGYTTAYPLFGVGRAGYYQSLNLSTNGNNGYYMGRSRSGSSSNSTVQSSVTFNTTPHTFQISQIDGFYIDGTKIGTFTQYTFTETYNIYLFGWNSYGTFTDGCNGRIYYMKISESGTLVRNFIPCYRKSDNVVGLYDLVNNQFYTNSGSGTFSKGSDVNTYRESSLKNAYIGEVYEYSYDFRNKSSTILTNNGWTVWSGTLGFTSNGIYASSGTVRMKKGGINLTNANKLTMKLNGYFGTGEYGFRVAKITSSNQLSNYSGMYFNVGSQKSLSVNSSEFSQSGLTAGFYSPIAVFDFVNKTSKLSVNGYSDITHSLTDAEISAIKANTDNIFIYLINNNSSSYFQDIKLLVE